MAKGGSGGYGTILDSEGGGRGMDEKESGGMISGDVGRKDDSPGAGVQSGLSEKEKFDAEDTLTGEALNGETSKSGPHKLETAEGPFKFK